MPNRFLKLLLFSFLVSVLFVFPDFTLAADPPVDACDGGVCCNTAANPNEFYGLDHPCDSWYEYGCPWGNGCGNGAAYGNDYGRIDYTQYCSGNSPNCDGNVTDNGWRVASYCNTWETCGDSGCACNSSCLGMPSGPYPTDNDENVKLPVTLMWNAVPGAQSYRYKIEGVTESATTTPYITIKNCVLKSNSTYNWQVQACCDTAGNNCGSWSDYWTFKTSLAPELLYPANDTENVPLPPEGIIFDWCDVEEAQSYYLRLYRSGEEIDLFPFPITKKDDVLESTFAEASGLLTPGSHYEWEVAACLNEDGTKCGFEYNDNQSGATYGEYSPRWKFNTWEQLPFPPLVAPENGTAVNQSDSLKWGEIHGAFSYLYQIKKGDVIVPIPDSYTTKMQVSFKDIWDYLEFDEENYSWQVASCWDEIGENCEENWSEERSFKTTGTPPAFNEEGSGPVNDAVNVSIPVKLNWDDMPGAASYYYSVANATGTVKKSEVLIEYPILKQNTNYNWSVKTCADDKGEMCGESIARNFTTFTLSLPGNPEPEDGGVFLTSERYLKWEGSPKIYRYKVDYQGEQKIPPTTVFNNSAFIPTYELALGEYIWYVQSCLDSNCQEASALAGPWHFTLVQGECKPGLIPCGRDCDVLETISYNERDPCEFKHIFLLLNNILNFVLWRLGLIILVLLALATGVIYYFSMGAPQTMVKVKSILKSTGIGYGIIFLAWLIINLILTLLGFQVELFGRWWQINF